MSDKPRILEKWTHGSAYGKSFAVQVKQPEGGLAYVAIVEVEGWPTFIDPIDERFERMEDAEVAGVRFAYSQIAE